MYRATLLLATACGLMSLAVQPAAAADVKITPLGSHDGEFCARDRAMIFEDPDGTRILYDPGQTVVGADDPRLGKIDAVLLSHVHTDHLGDRHTKAVNAGTCASPDMSVVDAPSSNTEKIVVAKKARFLVGGEMNSLFAKRIPAAGGDAKQVSVLRFGGDTKVGGVTVWSVPAAHTNGLSPVFLTGTIAKEMDEAGLTAYVGPPGGYVLRFSSGLVAYLSGDTGVISEQATVVRDELHAKLVVMNMGGGFSTGPQEAAFVINDLVKANSVIASHANEEATRNGKILPQSKTAAFKAATHVPVYASLSGKTMEFDTDGRCESGCPQ